MVPARTAELFAPGLRGLSIGLIATITLVALESLAIGTVLPLVGEELGQIELYGWVYSAFFLGNLLGVVVAGGALDRVPLWRPFAIGLVLFAVGLHDRRAGAVDGDPRRGAVRPGAGRRRRRPDGLRRDRPHAAGAPPAADVRAAVDRVGRARAWSGRRSRRSSASSRRGGWCSWACCRCSPSRAGLAVTALRRIPAAAPPEEHAAAAATVRRLPNALLAAAGAGLLVAALTAQELRRSSIGGAVIGLALLHPGLPAAHARRARSLLAAGVPAAVLLRGVMTFAFFSGDAYIPLLLQTWRGTPATLTGLVFTGDDDRLDRGDVAPGAAHRPSGARTGSSRWASRCVAIGALITIPAVLPGCAARAHVFTWLLPGLGHGLHVLRGDAGRAAGRQPDRDGRRVVRAPAVGHPRHGAGRRASPGAITAFGTRTGGDALGWSLAAVFADVARSRAGARRRSASRRIRLPAVR